MKLGVNTNEFNLEYSVALGCYTDQRVNSYRRFSSTFQEEDRLALLDPDEGTVLLRSIAVTDCPSTWCNTPEESNLQHLHFGSLQISNLNCYGRCSRPP